MNNPKKKNTGLDSRGRPIVVFVAGKMDVKNMDMDKFFLYILSFMDPIVASEYILVYIHAGLDADHRPTFNWLRNAYSVFNRKYEHKFVHSTIKILSKIDLRRM